LVNGIDVGTDSRAAIRQAGFVFANPDVQIVMPTVIEDVEFSLRDSNLSKAEKRERAMAALAGVGLHELAEAPAQTLSSGQKQLLAIAAITVRKPRLVIADEPTALLDAGNTRAIANLLLSPAAEQVILVTHDLALAQLCEVAVHFEAGRLANIGDPKEVVAGYSRQFS
jgi:biotin transport system ATP-binding protein